MKRVVEEVLRICEAGGRGCVATLVHSSGSVPMSRRAKLLVRADGSLVGTIGGGCLEAEVWRLARDVIRDGEPRILEASLTQDDAAEDGLVCGGRVEILLEPVGGPDDALLYRRIGRLLSGRGSGVLATVVEPLSQSLRHLLVCSRGRVAGSLGSAALEQAVVAEAPEVLRRGVPKTWTFAAQAGSVAQDAPEVRVFLEPVAPEPLLVVFGAGHVGLATAQMGALAGMRVVVVDDRSEFANADRFPLAEQIVVAPFEHVFDGLPVDESAYVVIVTRGHRHDEAVLRQALRTPARYIGMIGSRRKVALFFQRLREQGFSEADLRRVHAPIGLEIGADTPEEIAVSILAEIIAVRRGVQVAGRAPGARTAAPEE